ncbi:MAG: heme o synthase [Thermodesulfobacteriota bacterium]
MNNEYAAHRAEAFGGPVADYLILTKPGIVGLVLVSTLAGVYLGGRGMVELPLMLWTLAGVGLATAGSAMLNNYIDRDIDRLMPRTSSRALAAGTVRPALALASGVALVALSAALLALEVNVLTAALSAAAVFFYVVLYGMLMKRRTSWANQVGCVAGALPPVLGYAAATGTVPLEAVALFALVTFWQQPHALSLALKYRDEYAAAGIPVVPVALGVSRTKTRIALYTALLLPLSIVPYLLGMTGTVYLLAALPLGAFYLALAVRFLASKRSTDMFLFFYSIVYLTSVFTVMVADMRII